MVITLVCLLVLTIGYCVYLFDKNTSLRSDLEKTKTDLLTAIKQNVAFAKAAAQAEANKVETAVKNDVSNVIADIKTEVNKL